jgi:general secretion pathway protein J
MLRAKSTGFTLLEVLIAIAIFSLISLSSFTIFDTVLTSDETAKQRSERHNELQRAFVILERDLSQIARRSIRFDGEAPSENFLQTSEGIYLSDEQVLAFVRHGWTNPGLLLPRSDLQAISYQLVDETLERLHFNFVDAVGGEEPKVRRLISNVSALAFQFYDGKKWQETWSEKHLPLAIAIEVDTKEYGVIRRQFLVAGSVEPTTNIASGENP